MEDRQMMFDVGEPPKQKGKRKRKPGGGKWQYETQAQIQTVAWARAHADEWPCLAWLHAIPNGGKRDPRTAAVLKKSGLTPGIFDLFLPYPAHDYHGLYIEMKHGRNKVTPEQARFCAYANDAGYHAVVCYGAAEAIQAIEDYLTGV